MEIQHTLDRDENVTIEYKDGGATLKVYTVDGWREFEISLQELGKFLGIVQYAKAQ